MATQPPQEREFAFSETQFQEISALMGQLTGVRLDHSKYALVYARLTRRLRSLGLQSFADYCTLIKGTDGEEERVQMTDALTTNVTKFFREPHHFAHFKRQILPRAIKVAKAGGRVRFWSAGCSTGQEPFSLALTVLEALPDARAYDVKILASDISTKVLSAARQGRYSMEEHAAIPPELAHAWTEPDGDHFVFDDAVTRLIEFRRVNLIEAWPMKGLFDAIFCRNVMIYFSEALQNRLWPRFLHHLAPDGALYIGHAERISGPAAVNVRPDGVTTYRKAERAAA